MLVIRLHFEKDFVNFVGLAVSVVEGFLPNAFHGKSPEVVTNKGANSTRPVLPVTQRLTGSLVKQELFFAPGSEFGDFEHTIGGEVIAVDHANAFGNAAVRVSLAVLAD